MHAAQPLAVPASCKHNVAAYRQRPVWKPDLSYLPMRLVAILVIALMWPIVALAQPSSADLGRATAAAAIGTWSGSDTRQFETNLYASFNGGVCSKVIVSQQWDLVLATSPQANADGRGVLTVKTKWRAAFTGYAGAEPDCRQEVTGDRQKARAEQENKYSVRWSVNQIRPRVLDLDLDETDCQGDLCGRLGHMHRRVNVFESGKLAYERGGSYPAVILMRR